MCGRTLTSIGLSAITLAGLVGIAVAQSFRNGPSPELVGGPYKVIAADFTGDQVIDLVLGYHQVGLVTVERGDGTGRFSRLATHVAAEARPDRVQNVHNLAQADVDGDGLPDVALGVSGTPPAGYQTKEIPLDVVQAAWRGNIVLAKNTGQGRFQTMVEFPTPSEAKGVALADFDSDGQIDVAYTARGSGYKGDIANGRLFIRRGLGGWEFGPALEFEAGKSAYYVETADLNNDGLLDILVPNEHADTVSYWLNPGRALFQKRHAVPRRTVHATPIPGQRSHAINDVRAADFNGDGRIDLVTANLGTSTVSIFFGNGDGTFQPDTLLDGGKDGAFLAVGDLDHDGDLDFVITHWTGDFLSVFLNDGKGKFAARTDYKADLGTYGVTLCDTNGDGHLDAVTANYRSRSVSLLSGRGDGTFHPAVTTPAGLRLRDATLVPE